MIRLPVARINAGPPQSEFWSRRRLGLVFADVGLVKLFFESSSDTEPDVVLAAGKHQEDKAEVAALLCEALAP
jgi:hypothetical protein